MQHEPHVGIFWIVDSCIQPPQPVIDLTPISMAEPYGEALTHPRGHYEVWSAWQNLGVTGLRRKGLPQEIYSNDYEVFTRGRVVYFAKTNKYIIYIGRILNTNKIDIYKVFNLDKYNSIIKFDSHYI